MIDFSIHKFPSSRLGTIDVGAISRQKHHVSACIELDVTRAREEIRRFNRENSSKLSFNGWMISILASTVKQHESAAAYRKGRRKLVVFSDVNVSLVVEKEVNGQKVPIPVVIEKAQGRSAASVTEQIEAAKQSKITDKEIVLMKKAGRMERIYYSLPRFVRILAWKHLLRNPMLAFRKMGNVAYTTVGNIGKVNGWFIPTSVHPICFATGAIIKKPVVVDKQVEIREMLNMTIIFDHNVIDGAPAARLIRDLAKNVGNGLKVDYSD